MLHQDIQNYWDQRHSGYSQKNMKELHSAQKAKWQEELKHRLPEDLSIQILDIGTGPGFFPIVLKELGYGQITAIDASKNMLQTAEKNLRAFCGDLTDAVQFLQMDAQQMAFPDDSFDLIVMRNVTWNLEDPELAYKEWLRVLRPGGQILVYDANWYSYLYDEKARQQFEANLNQALEEDLEDYWHGEGVDEARIEAIAKQLPLTKRKRPEWDKKYLEQYANVTVEVNEAFGHHIWNREEELNYAATPMFSLYIRKK